MPVIKLLCFSLSPIPSTFSQGQFSIKCPHYFNSFLTTEFSVLISVSSNLSFTLLQELGLGLGILWIVPLLCLKTCNGDLLPTEWRSNLSSKHWSPTKYGSSHLHLKWNSLHYIPRRWKYRAVHFLGLTKSDLGMTCHLSNFYSSFKVQGEFYLFQNLSLNAGSDERHRETEREVCSEWRASFFVEGKWRMWSPEENPKFTT